MTPLLAALAVLALPPPASTAQAVKPPEPVLVVPFENGSREAALNWVSEGAALLLTGDLRRFGAAAIPRDERLKAFERLGLPPSALLSQATIIRVGQLIGATSAVVGSYTVQEGRLELRVRTIRLDSGSIAGELEERGAVADLFALSERLARRMVAGAAAHEPAPPEWRSLEAFELYVKGLGAETPAGQIKLLEAALARAPGDGATRFALWQVFTAQGEHERALDAVTTLPPSSPLAQRARFLAALSEIALQRLDAAFERLKALADETQAAPAFNDLGVVQLRRPAAAPQLGRATYYFTRAADLAPEDPDYAFNAGYAYWFERDAQGAVHWLREAVRRNPADADAHYVLGLALQAGGAQVEGEREKELARQLSSNYAAWQRRPPGSEVPPGLERLRLDLEAPRLSLFEKAAAPSEQREQRDLAAFHRERGQRLFEARRDVEAMAELGRSLYLLPYQADVHLLVGRIHQRAGRLREAAESFRISLWCQPAVDAHVALGEVLLLLGDTLGAQTEANRALTMDVNDAAARALLAKTEAK
ncbi:MAG: putative system TPR-repeat lipoprotein [Acidobacteria bacterium]|nr:putative system TPR-repeat lipoprotein [Acidobacteriota bacterium]